MTEERLSDLASERITYTVDEVCRNFVQEHFPNHLCLVLIDRVCSCNQTMLVNKVYPSR